MSARLPVYLDYAASTPLDARVARRMNAVLTDADAFGNASSAHAYGARARELVEAARAQVAAAVGCEPAEVIFCSCATEADNLAILGVAEYYRERGRHVVTSRTEHKAVLDACRELGRRGWQVSFVTPSSGGYVEPAAVVAALRADTVLATFMHVNNETGVVNDIAGIAAVCRERGVPLHVDAAQSVGKLPLDLAASGAALASLAGHKAYGPKGVGALVLRRSAGLQLAPQSYGGGQERGLRSGTLATHQIVGMGEAFALAARECEADRVRIAALAARLSERLLALGGVLRNGDAARAVPHILNLSFEGVEGESLLAAIVDRVALSTGSACTSAKAEPSYVLRALGRSASLAESSLRFSLGRFTTEAEVDTAAAAVAEAVLRLRAVSGYPWVAAGQAETVGAAGP